ncbi:class I SAM-dependent methyltransferase [Neorhizobium sp. P12A]|uniref:class I SAM-dependent methyltransferase n=1 Tax=Neorhizobium sp. P12A TaxID=2268027 RepID=UPI0011F084C6|nr:class I SAM-dependent methyltransferase [Neorhizobium sp. P12A]KAA0699878.1 class I SAM-dependent methyltransferase [Neorhizobium sp. P12A]
MERRFTFDASAKLYDDIRPQYPEALFDDIVDWTGLGPDDAILEIGCGSGQATEGFASRGFSVVALDPGAALLQIARQKLGHFPKVEFIETTFEAFSPGSTAFGLVVAAQSLHWVAPEIRFAKAAKMLAPGGSLAVMANVPMPIRSPLRQAFEQIYAAHAPSLTGPPPENWYLPDGPIAALWEASEYIDPPVHRSYPWSRMHTGSSYIDLLGTLSSHTLLAPSSRNQLFGAIADAIENHGGEFEMRYEAHLYMGRRRGGMAAY